MQDNSVTKTDTGQLERMSTILWNLSKPEVAEQRLLVYSEGKFASVSVLWLTWQSSESFV